MTTTIFILTPGTEGGVGLAQALGRQALDSGALSRPEIGLVKVSPEGLKWLRDSVEDGHGRLLVLALRGIAVSEVASTLRYFRAAAPGMALAVASDEGREACDRLLEQLGDDGQVPKYRIGKGTGWMGMADVARDFIGAPLQLVG